MTSSNGNVFRVTGILRGIHRSPVNSPHVYHWIMISSHHDHIHTHLLSYECRNKYTLCNIYQSGNLTPQIKRKEREKNHMSVLYMQCLDILNLIGLPDMVCMLNVCIWVNWIWVHMGDLESILLKTVLISVGITSQLRRILAHVPTALLSWHVRDFAMI